MLMTKKILHALTRPGDVGKGKATLFKFAMSKSEKNFKKKKRK